MSAGWVAGGVRAQALARRRLGGSAARELAACQGLEAALAVLADSPYSRDVRPGLSLAQAQRAIASTYLWNLRVLAGWTPVGGVRLVRLLTAWFEIANVEDRLTNTEHLTNTDDLTNTGEEPAPYELGSLSIAWRRGFGQAGDARDVRDRLAASWWQDPGEDSPRSIGLAMRLRLAERAASTVPGARAWALAAAALVVAREVVLAGRSLPSVATEATERLLGRPTLQGDLTTVAAFADRLPSDARWVFTGISRTEDLWRAETAWWARVERDGFGLLHQPPRSPAPAVGAAAVLACDAWRTRAALACAAQGGVRGAFDALA